MTLEMRCGNCHGRCRMTVTLNEKNQFASATGNACSNGARYAKEEIDNPYRVFTALVKIEGGAENVASVKSSLPVPKELLSAMEEFLKPVRMSAPVAYGDTVLANILNTGADIIITRAVPAQAIAAYA